MRFSASISCAILNSRNDAKYSSLQESRLQGSGGHAGFGGLGRQICHKGRGGFGLQSSTHGLLIQISGPGLHPGGPKGGWLSGAQLTGTCHPGGSGRQVEGGSGNGRGNGSLPHGPAVQCPGIQQPFHSPAHIRLLR